ncbi:uncharacterized protein A4U43_C05F21560 [Asparagus officinalis]|uniref:Uncharacterized protein n=1 Tax=Asparagus officinalis TaxID=4686 RepID=A0A5P1ETE2_ASPOF|nr:uncharacterized protein A4U43_C05F21560 [Asparagus officinalis]
MFTSLQEKRGLFIRVRIKNTSSQDPDKETGSKNVAYYGSDGRQVSGGCGGGDGGCGCEGGCGGCGGCGCEGGCGGCGGCGG